MKHQRFCLPVGVHLIVRKGKQILLMKRKNTGFSDGMWSLPVGAIDGKETLREAMQRESQEELGLEIKLEELVFLGIMHKLEDPSYENISAFFEYNLGTKIPINNEPQKCEQIAFFDENNMPENIAQYQLYFLNKDKSNFYLEWKRSSDLT